MYKNKTKWSKKSRINFDVNLKVDSLNLSHLPTIQYDARYDVFQTATGVGSISLFFCLNDFAYGQGKNYISLIGNAADAVNSEFGWNLHITKTNPSGTDTMSFCVIQFQYGSTSTGGINYSFAVANLKQNTVYHLVLNKTGQAYQTYLNGIEITTTSGFNLGTTPPENSTNGIVLSGKVLLGGVYNTAVVSLNNIALFNKALSLDEVKFLQAEGSVLPVTAHPNVLGYWTCQEKYGNKAYDSVEVFNYAKVTPLTPNHCALNGYTDAETGVTDPVQQTNKIDLYRKQIKDFFASDKAIWFGQGSYFHYTMYGLPTGSRTVSFWLKQTERVGTANVLGYGYTAQGQMMDVLILGGNYLNNHRYNDAANEFSGPESQTVLNKVEFVSFVWDNSGSVTNAKLYRDGVLAKEINFPVKYTTTDFGYLRIGDGLYNYFAGGRFALRDVQFWDGVRTVEQINADMAGNFSTSDPNLKGYFKLDDPNNPVEFNGRQTNITYYGASRLEHTMVNDKEVKTKLPELHTGLKAFVRADLDVRCTVASGNPAYNLFQDAFTVRLGIYLSSFSTNAILYRWAGADWIFYADATSIQVRIGLGSVVASIPHNGVTGFYAISLCRDFNQTGLTFMVNNAKVTVANYAIGSVTEMTHSYGSFVPTGYYITASGKRKNSTFRDHLEFFNNGAIANTYKTDCVYYRNYSKLYLGTKIQDLSGNGNDGVLYNYTSTELDSTHADYVFKRLNTLR